MSKCQIHTLRQWNLLNSRTTRQVVSLAGFTEWSGFSCRGIRPAMRARDSGIVVREMAVALASQAFKVLNGTRFQIGDLNALPV